MHYYDAEQEEVEINEMGKPYKPFHIPGWVLWIGFCLLVLAGGMLMGYLFFGVKF